MTLLAGIVRENRLIMESAWQKHVATLPSPAPVKTLNEALQLVQQELSAAVKKRISDHHFGILFSGGVDSALLATLAKQHTDNFTCYTVGVEGAKDLAAAKTLAKIMNFPLKTDVLTLDEVEFLLKKVIRILPMKDTVNIEIALTGLAAIELAKHNNDTVLFSGLGAEEIFAGYQRHAEAKDVNKECWAGLKKMWRKDLLRDFSIATTTKVTVLTPFLDPSLITAAMRIPGQWKIKNNDRKIILQQVASELGIPKEFAFRRKLAAQYGSSISKALTILAKKKGFAYKQEYLQTLFANSD